MFGVLFKIVVNTHNIKLTTLTICLIAQLSSIEFIRIVV